MKLCVTGGAGYIGSIVTHTLLQRGHDVTVLDNLNTGHRSAISKDVRFVEGDIRNDESVDEALRGADAVLHFAALSLVGESVQQPLMYFNNNVAGTVSLLEGMQRAGIERFVFSSSAAVYGAPDGLPITEDAVTRPENPYGESKLMVEKILRAANAAWGVRFVALRYFNAGGSTDVLGEDHRPESHLIPIVLDTIRGVRDEFTIFGDDYDTPDGTCIRDYIHVVDLADAHARALAAMDRGFSGSLNLGSDTPFTVLEVVKTAEKITGKSVNFRIGNRRPGDPPALLASSQKAQDILGWHKQHSDLESIIRSAYDWRLRNPEGYDA